MNGVAFVLSVVVLLLAWDRQRVTNWRTARVYANVVHLVNAAVGLWGLWESCFGEVPAILWALLVASALWLAWTLREWIGGVPRHIQTRPGDLGPPELERFK